MSENVSIYEKKYMEIYNLLYGRGEEMTDEQIIEKILEITQTPA